ncbi:2'-5' RNA ligase family protein [Pelomonas sp. SE-A7]|uniref:2'-5' RNA ligase family protein n=1 Tax=Pelomonas sp. SE-A7 TaxID=3054953 RepID=UPI00259CD36C|nr:2'-5' RNA ligase family protein [Pelomonas sp. SE-A7]MDM4767884.1 2'-5' RNA ligase family protein [Pelomonas sp. SE-A7]
MPEAALRRQLSLYLSGPETLLVERARGLLDPLQQSLIPAHLTLCREDELGDLAEPDGLLQQLSAGADFPVLDLVLGAPRQFHETGWLLPCVQGAEAFARLRSQLLGREPAREQQAHLTLAHPRNPAPSASALAQALPLLPDRLPIRLDRLRLIEQRGAGRWRELACHALGAS